MSKAKLMNTAAVSDANVKSLVTETSDSIFAGKNAIPNLIERTAEYASLGRFDLTDHNVNKKDDKSVQDSATEIAEAVAADSWSRHKSRLADKYVGKLKSVARNAVTLGVNFKDCGSILADVREAHTVAGEDARKLEEAMLSVIREQVEGAPKNVKARLTKARIAELVAKKQGKKKALLDLWNVAVNAVGPSILEANGGKKGVVDNSDDVTIAIRRNVIAAMVQIRNELKKQADEEERLANEEKEEEQPDALAMFRMAAASTSTPTKRQKA
jgi:hypothetical protein